MQRSIRKKNMKIHLISYTSQPLKSIAAPILNIGIGRDIKDLDQIGRKEAISAFHDTLKSYLTSPLEFASFNFFWEDIPLFMRTELERARVGWGYAERSLRFYQAEERDPIERLDWRAFPSIKTEKQKQLFLESIQKEMQDYEHLKSEGIETQDARNVIGVWFGTALQTTANFRALRDTMAVRLSSQAHPMWQYAAKRIKQLVSDVDPVLGKALVDMCMIQGRCIWQSKLDRPCFDCKNRGWALNHVHKYTIKLKNNKRQCSCGETKDYA